MEPSQAVEVLPQLHPSKFPDTIRLLCFPHLLPQHLLISSSSSITNRCHVKIEPLLIQTKKRSNIYKRNMSEPLITRKPITGSDGWRDQKHEIASQNQNGGGTNGGMGSVGDTRNNCHGCPAEAKPNSERQATTQLTLGASCANVRLVLLLRRSVSLCMWWWGWCWRLGVGMT